MCLSAWRREGGQRGDGGQATAVGDDFGHARLIADFKPEEMYEAKADGALEFVGGVEDELAVGGQNDSRDGLADGLGEVIPAVADGEPGRPGRGVGWQGLGGRFGFGAVVCAHVH